MNYLDGFLKWFPDPIQFIYGGIAIMGGIARYLNSYTTGASFNISMFFASTFVSGFSGYMFALVGISLSMPQAFIFIMAGTGGFFGEQTMKFVLEYTQFKAVIASKEE